MSDDAPDWDEHDLAALNYHWDGAYLFRRDDRGWHALPLLPGPADELHAATAEALRDMVRADHAERTAK